MGRAQPQQCVCAVITRKKDVSRLMCAVMNVRDEMSLYVATAPCIPDTLQKYICCTKTSSRCLFFPINKERR